MADCIFCAIALGTAPASVVFADDRYLAFMDIHPAQLGHVLVVPRRHAPLLADLSAPEAEALFGLARRVALALGHSGLPCDGVNLLLNDGAAANQTVPHAHVHVVPRRRGDLGAIVARLARRPLGRILGPTPRARLDEQAAAIRSAMG
jgi:diadenosine tetraphosphate (Ap4A) HIT family hydrolase